MGRRSPLGLQPKDPESDPPADWQVSQLCQPAVGGLMSLENGKVHQFHRRKSDGSGCYVDAASEASKLRVVASKLITRLLERESNWEGAAGARAL